MWDERLAIHELSQKTHSDYVYWLRILTHVFGDKLLCQITKDAKEMIGHRDISMTDRYSHLTNGRMLTLQRQLATHYENPSSPT